MSSWVRMAAGRATSSKQLESSVQRLSDELTTNHCYGVEFVQEYRHFPALYKSSFPRTRSENVSHILLNAQNTSTIYEVSLWNPIDDPKPAWRFKTENLRRITGPIIVGRSPFKKTDKSREQGLVALEAIKLHTDDPARSLLDQLREYAIYCANTPTLRGISPDQQTREPIGLSGGRLPQAIMELIRAAKTTNDTSLTKGLDRAQELIDWAITFGSGASARMPLSPSAAGSPQVVRFIDRFMAKRRNVLTGYDASEGALYILFAAVLILHPKSPQFLAIDNVDQALNPALAKRLSEAICDWTLNSSRSKQVLLTSHNPAVLDGLPLKDDRVRLFTLDRDHRGHTIVERVVLTEKILQKAKEGWTLSRLWMNGLIGGIPDV
jgi:hypothetical protein